MRHVRVVAPFVALGLSVVAPAGVTTAQEPNDLDMRIAKNARLLDGGQSARLRVAASCPVGGELLESFVYVNQGGHSTEFGAVTVPCDGRRHRVTVTVTALDFVLERGRASASGYMLLTSGDAISPVRSIKLR